MKKDNLLVVLFAILVLLSGTLFILSNVILEDTKTIEIIIAIFLFVIGLGTYIYSKKTESFIQTIDVFCIYTKDISANWKGYNLKIKRGNKAKNKEKGQSAPYPK